MSSSAVSNIGRRIELVSMDSHSHDISLGLYQQGKGDETSFLVHTYSRRRGAANRVAFVAEAMAALGGMRIDGGRANVVRFGCEDVHQFACRRIFLEASKLASDSQLAAKPLAIFDKKLDQTIELLSHGDGEYLVRADGNEEKHQRRAAVAALGLVRLGEMEPVTGTSDRIRFECGTSHDAVVGLLLTRALNVRTAMREVEAQAARGMLAAPSAQAN